MYFLFSPIGVWWRDFPRAPGLRASGPNPVGTRAHQSRKDVRTGCRLRREGEAWLICGTCRLPEVGNGDHLTLHPEDTTLVPLGPPPPREKVRPHFRPDGKMAGLLSTPPPNRDRFEGPTSRPLFEYRGRGWQVVDRRGIQPLWRTASKETLLPQQSRRLGLAEVKPGPQPFSVGEQQSPVLAGTAVMPSLPTPTAPVPLYAVHPTTRSA